MNKMMILCLGILIINLSLSTQQVTTGNTTTLKTNADHNVSNATGLGPWPTTLCLLIPPAILTFILSILN